MRQVRTRTRRNCMELRQRHSYGVGELINPEADGKDNAQKSSI